MYKYLPPERIDVLSSKKICFNNPRNFNDPFEFYALFEQNRLCNNLKEFVGGMNLSNAMNEEMKLIYSQLPQSKQMEKIGKQFQPVMMELIEKFKPTIINSANHVYENFNDTFVNVTRVLCLSETKDNLLMWGHYADSHRGFVLEFDVNNSFFNQRKNQKDEYGYLRKVNYNKDIDVLDPLSGDVFNHFLSKNQDWEYEREWRMLLPESQSQEKIHHEGLTFDLYAFPPNAIKSVILGCNIHDSVESKLKSIIIEDKDYSHIKLFKCYRSNERYELIITPVIEKCS